MQHRIYLSFLALVSTFIFLTLQLSVQTDISDFFFSGSEKEAAFLVGQMQSDEVSRRYLISISRHGVTDKNINRFAQNFQIQLQESDQLNALFGHSLTSQEVESLLELYSRYSIQLRSIKPEEDIHALFTPDSLRLKAESVRKMLTGPDPILAKELLTRDPMLLVLSWFAVIQNNSTEKAVPLDYINFVLQTQASGTDSKAQLDIQRLIEQTFNQLNQQVNNAFQLEYTGVPVFATHIKQSIAKDISTVSLVSATAIILLFLIVFRSISALFVIVISLISTIAVAAAITQIVFGNVHGLTLAIGTTLIGVCIDFFIHGMAHSNQKQLQAKSDAIRRIWPSLLLAGVTTALGYIALGSTGFPGLKQISVFAVAGISTALLLTRFVLPALLFVFKTQVKPSFNTVSLLNTLDNKGILFGIIILTPLLAGLGVPKLQWQSELDNLSPDLQHLKQLDKRIRSRMADFEPGRFILSQANTLEDALLISENVHHTLSDLQSEGAIEKFSSLYPWLASHTLQSRNVIAWNSMLSEENKRLWKAAVSQNGLSADHIPQLQKSEDTPLTLASLKTSPVWPLISSQWIKSNDQYIIATWLGTHDAERVQNAIRKITGSHYYSQKQSIARVAGEYRHRAAWLLTIGLIAIILLLSIRYRSIKYAFSVLSPALIAVTVVASVSGIMNAALGVLHLIGFLLVVAMSVDYAILFFENRSGSVEQTFQAITLSALTSIISFTCLASAMNPTLNALAYTVAPGIAIGYLVGPVLLRKHIALRHTGNLFEN